MRRRDGELRLHWGRGVIGTCVGGALLLSVALGQAAGAQGVPSDSQQQRPPDVDRVRQRIEDIRRSSTEWRRRLGTRLSGESPSQSASSSSERSPASPQNGPTRADLGRLERRLRAVVREMLGDEFALLRYEEGRADAERPADLRPSPPDTVRIAPPVSDTVRMTASVRDTLRELRVEQVERRLLDTGVFRAFEVNFAFAQSTLQPRATRTLDAVGEVVRRYPDLRLEVAGHTDAVGSDAFNQRLSEARAAAVRTYLIENFDLAPLRLVARGYGETRPIATNDERAGRALNRRVEFVVLNEDGLP